MPIPSPQPGETEDAFMGRCIPALRSEDESKPEDQIAAICSTRFEEAYPREKKKRKRKGMREAVPTELNCDALAIEPADVNAGGAALLHGWAHKLWAAGVRGPGVIEAHADAITVGEANGLAHVVCDDLDSVEYPTEMTENH